MAKFEKIRNEKTVEILKNTTDDGRFGRDFEL